MDEGLVFHKTELGAAEVGAPSGKLAPKLRRCLILVDGEKSVGELAAMFRAGELATILRDLQAGGYVTSDEPAGADTAEGITGLTEANFAAVRQRAMREVSDRLGPGGDPLALKISACDSAEELRPVLREAQQILGQFLGAEYARTFTKKIGIA